ncbi:MAG: DUF502 domain-containing protein [Candidatus Competibacterales bacterium]
MNSTAKKKPSFTSSLITTFIAGFLAALPLVLTVAVLLWLVDLIQHYLGPSSTFGQLLRSIGWQFAVTEAGAYVIGAISMIAAIYFLGIVVEAGMKSQWNNLVDGIMNRLPPVRGIYHTLKKLMNMFDAKEQSDMKNMGTVMCYFGGKGGTAVLALMPSSKRINLEGIDYYGVLIPTAPVPFGGAILYVPVDWVEPVDMAFDDLVNVYMSMGATSAASLNSTVTPAAKARVLGENPPA